MKKIALSCGLALLCGTHVYAMPKQVLSSGVFVTGDAGYGHLFTPSAEINSGGSNDRNHFVWSGGIGYGWAMDSFTLVGVEADYFDNGQSTYNSGSGPGGSLKVTSVSEAVLFSFTSLWSNGINIFLKGGPAYVQQKNDFSGPTSVNNQTVSGSGTKNFLSAMAVAGMGYYVAKNLNVFIDGTYLFGHTNSNWSSASSSSSAANNVSSAASAQIKLGLSYQF